MSAAHVQFFFPMREQIKLYHWQTKSFSRHKATDEVIDKLDKLIDQFVEVFMGKYGRPRLTSKTNTVKLTNMTESTAGRFIRNCLKEIQSLRGKVSDRDTDLQNICDEMLGDLNQLLYLFSLGA